ncbi:adhesion G protein-coupled receptor L4-like [Haliotis cracherodii]|uniref:adhesion G protein-coupled receptor L4-like n=1 Tax=Haliotis cracherodii TaxID=6455 RepID=UPI0039EC040E
MKTVLLGVVFLCSLSAARADCELGEQPISLIRWSGVVRSPGFEKRMYPNYQNCTWNIRVNSGSRINMTFTQFDLEVGRFINADPRDKKNTCTDYVRITDGSDVLFQGCGKQGTEGLLSNSNEVTINFVTDESGQPPGFSLQYTGVPSDEISEDTFIETPGYPDYPPRDQIFEWKIAPKENAITIVRGIAFNDSLPWCGDSPVTAINEENEVWNKELCLADYALFSPGNITLVYNATADTNPWVGRLQVIYKPGRPSCSNMCDNSTDNLKTCLDPRDLTGRMYTCICEEKYAGKHCEVAKSTLEPCYSTPCQHNGSCTEVDHSYQCGCLEGYTGKNCETDIDFCNGVACQNGGTCVDGTDQFQCACVTGYRGQLCEIDINECEVSPCQHEGTCENKIGSYSCTCAKGYKGNQCELPYDDCDWEPCYHGGTCLEEKDGFHCACTPEYTGRKCSIPIDSAHCLEDQDRTFGSGLTWQDTLADRVDIVSCPPGIIGNATRKCVHDSSTPTGGRWTRPDLGECVSPRIMEINELAKALQDSRTVDSAAIEDVTRRLANATSVVRDHQGAQLYPGDLVFATGIVRIVSIAVTTAHDLSDQLQSIADLYGDAVDNIVDPETIIIWRNTKTSMIGEKMTSLLESTEALAENLMMHQFRRRRSVNSITSNDPLVVTSRNLEFRVTSVQKGVNVTHLPAFAGSADSSFIELPSTVADIASGNTDGSSFNIYYAKFRSVATLLSLKEDRHNGSEPGTVGVVNSDVISSRVLGVPETSFRSLDQPVIVTFSLKNTTLRGNLTEYCVFMNMTALSDKTRWSRDGCQLKSFNGSHVTCHCYHLTNFAILMDVYGTSEQLDDSNSLVLSYISYIGGSLSILGCLATIIVFQYFRLRSDRVRIHEQLAACIICVQAVFLIGFSRTENSATPTWACKTVAILLHYFLTAMFCWMLVEGIHLYVALVKVFKRGSHIKKYVAIGWGVPLVIVGISVGVFYHSYGTNKICWLNNEMLLVCFVPTVGLVVVINTVILCMVLRVMLRSLHSSAKVASSKEEKSGLWMSLKAAAVLLPLLGLTWMLGFLAVDVPGTEVLGYVFTYLFTICNSFQGVVFFLFHCLLNSDVHSAYDRRYKKRKRLTTMTSNDITTLRRKKSSSDNDTYVAEPSTVKTSMDKNFDISFVARKDSRTYPDEQMQLERQHSNFDDYDVSDTEKIWRRSSVDQDMRYDSFPRHFRQIGTYNAGFPNANDMESAFDGPPGSTVKFH